MRHIPFILALLTMASQLRGQGMNTFDEQITDAYLKDEMPIWRQTLTRMENFYNQEPSDSLLLHLTINQYGYIGYLVDSNQEDKANELLQKAAKNCEKLIEKGYCVESFSVKAGLVGYRIMMNPIKAPFLGPKNDKHTSKAIKCDSLNPMPWSQKGNAYYHMPGMFGGSYEKAARYFKKAVTLYEKQQRSYPRWLYLNDLMWYGKSLAADGQTSRARKIYQKALEIAPNFKRIKEELLPALNN